MRKHIKRLWYIPSLAFWILAWKICPQAIEIATAIIFIGASVMCACFADREENEYSDGDQDRTITVFMKDGKTNIKSDQTKGGAKNIVNWITKHNWTKHDWVHLLDHDGNVIGFNIHQVASFEVRKKNHIN